MIKQIMRDDAIDKQKISLNIIVTAVSDVDILMNSTAEGMMAEAKKSLGVEDLELFAMQLKLVRNTVKKFLGHLKLNVASLTMKLDLQSKFPDKLNTSESVDEVVNVLVLGVESFANYLRSLSREDDN